jgi:hypothetical protein
MANNKASRKMAKLILSEKKENGNYQFRQKMVPEDDVKEELKAAQEKAK